MPRPPKLTQAEVRRWRERCWREGCDGFVCTVGNLRRHWYKQCHKCGAIKYYRGNHPSTAAEYAGDQERAQGQRQPTGRRVSREREDDMAKDKKKKGKKGAKGKTKAAAGKSKSKRKRCAGSPERILKVGTKLIGTYKGKEYSCTVVKNGDKIGFKAGKTVCQSLSRAAMILTGMPSVNGWLFFGLC